MMRRVTGVLVAVLGVAIAGLIFASCQAPGSVLRGKLTTTSGTHVAGVAVAVYSNTTDDVVARTTTDADGDYSFLPAALPDGTYKILFVSNDWWENATSWADATPVTATTAAPAAINATVNVATGSVSGTVTNTTTSTPAAGVTASAISTSSGSTIATTTTAGNGTYSFGSLPVGSYVFEFTGPGLTTRYNNSSLTQSSAPVITVTGGSTTTGIDTAVAANATITGTVTNGTTPASGILAVAYNPTTGDILAHTLTGTDGTFTIPGLDNGTYTVGFGDLTGHLQPLIYGSTSLDPTTGTTVTPVGGTINIGTITLAPYTVTDAPTGVTATAGNSQATVSWTAPESDGGSTITGYTVTASTGQTCDTTGALTCTVTGLTNGTAVTFTVAATNALGTSPASTASAAITPSTYPDAPTGLTATVTSPGNVILNWTAPVNDGGSAITSYFLNINDTGTPVGGSDFNTAASHTSFDTSVWSPLPTDIPITAEVNARNADGLGLPSTVLTFFAANVPDAPTGVLDIPTATQATVSWSAPGNNGGSPITGYTVTASTGQTCTTTGDSCIVTGLTNGTTVTFTVTATNAPGTSVPSAPSTAITQATVPDAPTTVTDAVGAIPGGSQALVSWAASATNGGSTIAGYTVTASTGQTCDTTGALSCTVTGLSNGTAVTFTVTATNALGTSSPSAPTTVVTPVAGPDASTGLTATVTSPGSVTLNWIAPANDGGSPITSYSIHINPTPSNPLGGSYTDGNGTSTSYDASGLPTDTPTMVTIWANNVLGQGAPTQITFFAANAPDAPTGVTAIPGDSQATVSWTAPDTDGGSSITGYTVTASTGQTCDTTGAPSCTVTGLTNGTDDTFTVTATNAVGTSNASLPSAAIIVGTPTAPTGVTAMPANSQATVSWTAPTTDNGAAITGYTVTSSGGQTCTTTSATSCVVTGLTNGTSYTFTVTATNASGTGPASAASAPVTPAVAPDAPTAVAASGGNSTATVNWTASYDGGSPITGYTATSSGGQTCTTTGSTSCVVTGLTNGTSYTFTVTATNAVGTSTASTASAAVTPLGLPSAVIGLTYTIPSPGDATLSWSPPTDDGGSPIVEYEVVVSAYGSYPFGYTYYASSTSFDFGTAGAPVFPTNIPITVHIAAGTTAGWGTPSSVTFVAARQPDAPRSVTVAPGTGQATIAWTPPVSDGGVPITGYTATSSGGQTCTTNGATTCVVTGLTNGDSYSFTVTATNNKGTSDASAPSTAVVVGTPDMPTGVAAASAAGQATVTWTASSTDGGSPITTYTVTSSGGQTCTTTGATTCVVTGLTNGGSYTFTVTASNAVGTSAPSDPSASIVIDLPLAPTGVTATPSNGQAHVSWIAPADNGTTPITGYVATSSSGATCSTSGATSCTIFGLTNGVSYTFTVTATNDGGTSPVSAPSAPITVATFPNAPSNVHAVGGVGRITISWTDATVDGGSPITSYSAFSSPFGSCYALPGVQSCVITGLAAGSYTAWAQTNTAYGSQSGSAVSVTVQ